MRYRAWTRAERAAAIRAMRRIKRNGPPPDGRLAAPEPIHPCEVCGQEVAAEVVARYRRRIHRLCMSSALLPTGDTR